MRSFYVMLEARNPESGHYRAYRLEAGQDLFGTWLVDMTYGRIGSRGRTLRYLARDEAEAKKLVRRSLRKRGTVRKRIGVEYQIKELSDPAGWLRS
jgi:hypothetical protein